MEMRDQLEKDLTCLKLAYPTNFQLSLVSMDDTNFGELNWILSTHLMVLAWVLFQELFVRTFSNPAVDASPSCSE